MAASNMLCKVDSLLSNAYKEQSGKLEESQIGMSLNINNQGKKYLLYSFDKVVKHNKSNKSVDLQPYFKANTGVKSMCDYFLFCWEKGKLYVLLIELKQGEEQVTRQLSAGSIFAVYLINTLNCVENITIEPVIRKISVRDYHINRKGTSMKPVVYDNQSFCTFGGSEFQLLEFLQ